MAQNHHSDVRQPSSSSYDAGSPDSASPSARITPPPALTGQDRPNRSDGGAILSILDLTAGYDSKRVIRNVNLSVQPGEIVALIGHNGAGKTTLLKAIFGILQRWSGEISFEGQVVRSVSPRWWLEHHVTYLPQGGGLFGSLSVKENLEVVLRHLPRQRRGDRVDRALAEFPELQACLDRRAFTLSGGERQSVSMAMSLMLDSRLLLMDEPSLGLAPRLVREALDRISRVQREQNTSILIVEQKVREILRIADRVVVLKGGAVSWVGCSSGLRGNDEELRRVYL